MRPRNLGFDVIGGREIMMAEDQLDLIPIAATVAVAEGDDFPTYWMRWTLSQEERQRIAAGEDLTISMPHGVHPYTLRLLRDAFPEGGHGG